MANKAASFLGLPAELRLPIYKLLFNRYDHIEKPNILLVSRQIRSEALPLYLEWTRYFSTFEGLINWTSTGKPDLLHHVKDVSIQILAYQDLWDPLLSAIRKAAGKGIAQGAEQYSGAWWTAQFAACGGDLPDVASPAPARSRLLVRDRLIPQRLQTIFKSKQGDLPTATQDESFIHQFWLALTAMDNVQSCWINLSHEDLRIQPILQFLLRMISVAFPAVRSLSCFCPLVKLEFLGHFRDLRMLRFTGYSNSSPEELLEILRSLESLDSISIYRYPEFHGNDQGIRTADLTKHLALTAEVIAGMKPLRFLQICHMTSGVASEHLTAPMIEAWGTHRSSLRTLKIETDERLNEAVVSKLLGFVAASSLTRIHLRSQGDMKPLDISDYIPTTVRYCDARLKCDGYGTRIASSSTRFHNHTFSEVDIRDPQYAKILGDSFANQVLH